MRAFWKAALLCVRGLFNPQPAETAAASPALTRRFLFVVFFPPERGIFFITRSLFAGFLFPVRRTVFIFAVSCLLSLSFPNAATP